MTRPGAGRVALSVALGAALAACVIAYAPLHGRSRLLVSVIAFVLPAAARWIEWWIAPPGLIRAAPRVLQALLIATGALLFSRQLFLLTPRAALVSGAVIAVAGSILAFGFLCGRRLWTAEAGILPATVGLLAVAGADPGLEASFLPLACIAGAAIWTYAALSGGPRRFGWPSVVFLVASAALTAAIIWTLPAAQPHVEAFMARAYGEGRTGLSDRSELGEVESLAQSHRIVARVWTTQPQLLRMQVFTRFDGRSWSLDAQGQRDLRQLDATRAADTALGPLLRAVPGNIFVIAPPKDGGAGLVETRIVPALSFDDGWGLLVPAGPMLVAWPGDTLSIDEAGRITAQGDTAHLYGVANRERARRDAGTTPTDLLLPVVVDARVRDLAADLRDGARSDREIVDRTLGYLRSNYRYTLEIGKFRGSDPLAEFLFDKKAGYCEYFATAAVVLLRVQGIPARYVKGLSVGGTGLVGGHYVVRESDAHAWIDAYVRGEGWIEADPTPANAYELTHDMSGPGLLGRAWEAIRARASEGWARFRQGTWPAFLAWAARAMDAAPAAAVVLAVLAAFVYAIRWHRRRDRRPAPRDIEPRVPHDLHAALASVEGHWARRGRPRPASRGFQEHLDAMPGGALSPQGLATSARVVESYYETRFGGRTPSPDVLAALRQEARALDEPAP